MVLVVGFEILITGKGSVQLLKSKGIVLAEMLWDAAGYSWIC